MSPVGEDRLRSITGLSKENVSTRASTQSGTARLSSTASRARHESVTSDLVCQIAHRFEARHCSNAWRDQEKDFEPTRGPVALSRATWVSAPRCFFG